MMKQIGKYSFGLGDRFGHQGHAQLRAIIEAERKGVEITPVWNKSNREHIIIGTSPCDVRLEADTVTELAGFRRPYYVDADHINLDTVERFIADSDFFTIDVASYIGKRAEESVLEAFVSDTLKFTGEFVIPGTGISERIKSPDIKDIAEKYLFAAIKAGEIYSRIELSKGAGNFVAEVSMDEVSSPQTPVELFFILKMLAENNVPCQTIAPKFSGRFNKGVDYVGDPQQFAEEFEKDLMVIDLAVREFGLPENLKLSVHSGSDKFTIYPFIGSLIRKHDKGLHIKTAGTTWLEEVIGLAEAGSRALEFVKEIYAGALEKRDELCAPYADVIDIDPTRLPTSDEVSAWNSVKFAEALTHVPGTKGFNPDMRQLIHVGYKIAAERMDEFFMLLDEYREIVAECVFNNIYHRHIRRIFNIG